ncbi:MAG TPA: hypothetical protein VKV69_10820 [Actinomycetota bacterium]|nr:hypothetical protein [Actinomycetota bacterium]
MRRVTEGALLYAVVSVYPVEDRLVRDAERARDLTQAHPFLVHRHRFALMLPPERATFGFTHELPEPADLSFGGAPWLVVVQEDGRAGATMIICAHMAGAAERDEVVERVVTTEAERLQVMDIERAAALGARQAASLTDDVARADLFLDCLPTGAVGESAPALPVGISLTQEIPRVVSGCCAAARAVLPAT